MRPTIAAPVAFAAGLSGAIAGLPAVYVPAMLFMFACGILAHANETRRNNGNPNQ